MKNTLTEKKQNMGKFFKNQNSMRKLILVKIFL